MIVAETAGDRRASGKILFDEGTDYVALKTLFVIDDIVRDADGLGDTARVVDVVERAAASLDGLGHALVSSEAALVPELHRQADDVMPLNAEHGRYGRGVDSAGHGDRDGLGGHGGIVNGRGGTVPVGYPHPWQGGQGYPPHEPGPNLSGYIDHYRLN